MRHLIKLILLCTVLLKCAGTALGQEVPPPIPDSRESITVQNSGNVTEVARLGQGHFLEAA